MSLLQDAPIKRYKLGTAERVFEYYGGVRSHADVRALLEGYRFADASPDLAQELEFLDGKHGDPGIEDWAVLLPQLKRPSDRSWPLVGHHLSVHRRDYWRKPLANAFTGPEDKAIAEAISGRREVANPTSDLVGLQSDRRAVLLVYPITHEPPPEREWVPTMGLTLQFPQNEIPQKIGFAVRSPRHADKPIIDVSESV